MWGGGGGEQAVCDCFIRRRKKGRGGTDPKGVSGRKVFGVYEHLQFREYVRLMVRQNTLTYTLDEHF